MIFQFIQTERLPKTKHQIIHNGNIIATSISPKHTEGILTGGNDRYKLNINTVNSIEIIKNDVSYATFQVGLVVTKKVLFLPIGYECYDFVSPNQVIRIVEIGLGANHHYWYFYDNDILVAVIHKKDEVVNYLDEYTCYLEDEKYFEVVSLYCLVLESTIYYDIEAFGYQVNDTSLYSAQKEVRERYDPNFIPRIKAMDGISERSKNER